MKASELRKKDIEALRKELIETLGEQFKLRMRQGSGQPVRPSEFGRVRKHIARIKTVLTEKRSGEAS